MSKLIASFTVVILLASVMPSTTISASRNLPSSLLDSGPLPLPFLQNHLNRLPLLTKDADLIVVADIGEIQYHNRSKYMLRGRVISSVSAIQEIRVKETLKGDRNRTISIIRSESNDTENSNTVTISPLDPETSAIFFLYIRAGRRIGNKLYNPLYFAYYDMGILTIEDDRAYPLEPLYFSKSDQDFYQTDEKGDTYFELDSLKEYIASNITYGTPTMGPRFSDISGNPHSQHIERLSDEGVTQGCGADPDQPRLLRYCPDRSTTRGELATFLVRALNVLPAIRDVFTDDEGHTHEESINQIADSGQWSISRLKEGCTDSGGATESVAADSNDTRKLFQFCPNQPVTRAEMAYYLAPMPPFSSSGRDIFQDDNGHPNELNINRIAALAITQGCNPPLYSHFCPERLVTRAEMATMLVRFMDYRKSQRGGTLRLPPEVFDHQPVTQSSTRATLERSD